MDAIREFGCIRVPIEGRDGLGKVGVATMGNSGYQAVNLAYLLGAKKIVMLGFDMEDRGGEHHFHGNHRGGTLTNPTIRTYARWRAGFETIYRLLRKEGVELVNCSRRTALNIPRADLCSVI